MTGTQSPICPLSESMREVYKPITLRCQICFWFGLHGFSKLISCNASNIITHLSPLKGNRQLSQWNLGSLRPCKTLKDARFRCSIIYWTTCICFVACDFHIWSRPLYVWLWLASLHPGGRWLLWANLLRLLPVRVTSGRNGEGSGVLWQRREILWTE